MVNDPKVEEKEDGGEVCVCEGEGKRFISPIDSLFLLSIHQLLPWKLCLCKK